MSTLAQHTSPELIVSQLRSRTAAGVIGELCATLEREGRVKDPLSFYNAVMSHEALSSTAISPGWALPHARVPGLERLSFALGRSAAPLDWLQHGGEPVQLIFLFAVPETDGVSYLTLISGLAKLSQDPIRMERLLRAPDNQAMLEVLKQIRLPQPRPAAIQN
jgi:mannitol/fructose-specific phosphotransferase system IIA component (Ntr-type)